MRLFGPNIDELKARKDVEGLVEALKDSYEWVRRAAAGALGEIGDERAVEPLIEALKDSDRRVRLRAAEALEKIASNTINEAQSLLQRARELGINIKSEEEKLNDAKLELDKEDFPNAAKLANECKNSLKLAIGKAKPEIEVDIPLKEYKLNYWKRTKFILKNKGDGHARGVEIELSDVVSAELIGKVDLDAGEEKELEVVLKPKEEGEVPLRVKLKYKDLKGREYESERVFLINVSDAEREEREERKAFRAVRGFPEELLEIYEVEGFLGEGGFARVYKVRRKRDGELVAVKIPKGIDATTGKSFLRELTNWRNLRHENIVGISDANIFPVPYLEMEYCDKSLADIEFSVEDALNIAIQIAEGLKYAHSKGIAHKDLKPQNILIKGGKAKISDWGLSKALSESTSSLQAFSPFYAAPEQISKKFGKTDERTDIWQFGVLLYEILTGKRPFEGDDVVQIAFSILNEEPAPPSTFRKEAAIFDEIVMKCLRKRKEERPSAEEIHAYLAKILRGRLEKQLEASKDFGESMEILKSLARLHTLTEEYEETARYLLKIADISSGNEREIARKIANAFRLLLEMREICEKHPRVSDVVEKYEMILDALPANMAEAFDADERIGLLFKRMKAELRDEQHLDTQHIEELRHFCHLFAERCLSYLL